MPKPEYTPEFERFWSAYPRKVGKFAGYKNWQQLRRQKVAASLLERAARHYAARCRNRGTIEDYIMHPGTFLGPRRYFEEYLDPPQADVPDHLRGVAEWAAEEGVFLERDQGGVPGGDVLPGDGLRDQDDEGTNPGLLGLFE
jgi:hypothetical protein